MSYEKEIILDFVDDSIELLLSSPAIFAQDKGVIYHEQITYDVSGLHIVPCPLPGTFGDTWRFTNSTSDTVNLAIFICVGKQDPNYYILASGDSVDHAINAIEAFVRVAMPRLGKVTQCGRENPPGCPTLTPWGIIILVGFIVVSAIHIMVRRKRATVSL